MRILTNICTDDLSASQAFYEKLLGLEAKYESDWYVQLHVPGNSELEYGLILRDHELVPLAYQQQPTGMYVTFVVDDVDQVFQQAKALGVPIVQPPRNEFYGQRRFLTRDPSGCLVDICSPWGDE